MVHTESQYYELSNFAKTFNYGTILTDIEDFFGYLHNKDEIDDVGFKLQVCVKNSKPMYLHGYILTSALYEYLDTQILDGITILEVGTARGFSSICMALILKEFDIQGTIHTIDRQDKFDNCIKAAELKRRVSVHECVEEWKDIVDKYIKFEKGDYKNKLKELDTKLDRINFAFLDAAEDYRTIKSQLEFIESKQKTDDIIILDDYTATQYPDIVRAVDDFIQNGNYYHKIFFGNDGIKNRGYVYLSKK